jgi:hypothetical protein
MFSLSSRNVAENDFSPRRRGVLRLIGTAVSTGAVLGGSGAVSAEDTDQLPSGSNGVTVESTSADTETDPAVVAKRLQEKAGREILTEDGKPRFPIPGGEMTLGSPGNKKNLEFLGSTNHQYTVKGAGIKLATTDSELLHFKGEEKTGAGRTLNFFWNWSQADPSDPLCCDPSYVEHVKARLDFKNTDDLLTDLSPIETRSVNGSYVRTGKTVKVNGTGVGVQSEVWVEDGDIGPVTGGVDFGKAGKGATIKNLDGQGIKEPQTHTTTWVLRTPYEPDEIDDIDFHWKTHTRANLNEWPDSIN